MESRRRGKVKNRVGYLYDHKARKAQSDDMESDPFWLVSPDGWRSSDGCVPSKVISSDGCVTAGMLAIGDDSPRQDEVSCSVVFGARLFFPQNIYKHAQSTKELRDASGCPRSKDRNRKTDNWWLFGSVDVVSCYRHKILKHWESLTENVYLTRWMTQRWVAIVLIVLKIVSSGIFSGLRARHQHGIISLD